MKRTFPLLLVGFTLLALFLTGCTGGQFVAASGWSGIAIGEGAGLVYVGARSGRVLALDGRTGVQRAIYPPLDRDPLKGLYGTPALSGGVLFVPGYDGRLYALDAADLSERWRYPNDASHLGEIVGGVTVAKGLVLFGSSDGYVRALRASNGLPEWEFKTGKKVWSAPAVDGEMAYVTSLNHKLYALNLLTGLPVWRAPFEADGAIVTTPLVDQGKVFFGSLDRHVYAVDTGTGMETWRFEGDGWFWSSLISDGQRLYAATTRGMLYALDINAGRSVWTFNLQHPVLSTPVLVEGNVVIGSDGGQLHVLAAENGAQASSPFNLGEKAQVQAPLATDGQVVYVNAMDRRVWAIRLARGRTEKLWEATTQTSGKE
ncbi:MAG: PQQ-binding-like beta-propeller repeat protein [Chloroflexi bacterium]|nr:PQQ-binding-like beta-propeller repeat protein [Chloroflexota bacterium]